MSVGTAMIVMAIGLIVLMGVAVASAVFAIVQFWPCRDKDKGEPKP